jgi:flagellar L-ring protein FlgH
MAGLLWAPFAESSAMRILVLVVLALASCGRLSEVGRYQHHAMYSTPLPEDAGDAGPTGASSLWAAGRTSLLGDRRAERTGDILTVVIEIDESAEISNSTDRSRSGSEEMQIEAMLGLPERLNDQLPAGASMANAVNAGSESSYEGEGAVRRNEELMLRVAATVVEELPNGVLRIEGQQEVRVNFELRELIVTGYVRPADVSRQNEITYDKIAGARISYGGRGQITDVQQPRYGQQITDILLPY